MTEGKNTLGLSIAWADEGEIPGFILTSTGKQRVTSGIEVNDPNLFEFDFPVCHIKVKRESQDIPLPKYSTDGAAGFDIAVKEDGIVEFGETKLIGTGLYFSVPKGFALIIAPRSGIALRTKFRVRNSPGILDPDFTGELCIVAYNDGYAPYKYKKGDRLAQGLILPVYRANFIEVDSLDETERGDGGYGSTGIKS